MLSISLAGRIAMPKSLGGDELPPADVVRVIEAVAEADGSAGWCVMIGSTTMVSLAYLPHVYAPPSVIRSLDGLGFLGDGRDDLGQSVFLGGEGLVPGDRAARLVDHLEGPFGICLEAKDGHADRHPVAGDLSAELGVDDVGIVVHGVPEDSARRLR